MPLTVTEGEGLTTITVTSNPKSKWPILCQIMGHLCYSPVCSVSRTDTGKLAKVHVALGVLQIIVGVINFAMGIVLASLGYNFNMYVIAYGPFWIGSVFIAVGIVCILLAKKASSCLLLLGMFLNIFSFALAITAVVLYAVDLSMGHYYYCDNYSYDSYYSSYQRYMTPTSEENKKLEMCLYKRNLYSMILGGLDIGMIVLSVLQVCVTISFCVVTAKSLCKKEDGEKIVEDPEIKKPLLEDFVGV